MVSAVTVASYLWRYNCIDNSDVSVLEPELEQEFYRHVANSEPLLLDVKAGCDRAAATLACILYNYKVLAVEETDCAFLGISISRWLALIRLKWTDPFQLDFRQVSIGQVAYFESLFLLHSFQGSSTGLVPPTCELVSDVEVGSHETANATAVIQSNEMPDFMDQSST